MNRDVPLSCRCFVQLLPSVLMWIFQSVNSCVVYVQFYLLDLCPFQNEKCVLIAQLAVSIVTEISCRVHDLANISNLFEDFKIALNDLMADDNRIKNDLHSIGKE